MSRTLISPEDMFIAKDRLKTKAAELQSCINSIDSTITNLTSSSYLTPDAKALALQLKSQKPMLDDMWMTIDKYGDYAGEVANRTIITEEETSSSFR